MSRRLPVVLFASLLSLALLAGCGSGGSSASEGTSGDGPRIVVTTSILGDLVQRLTDGSARVQVLMPPGTDPHDFEPSAAQAAALRSADLVVANGLGLEQGLASSLDAAKADGVDVLEVAPQLDPQPFPAGVAGEHAGDGHDGELDPHVWLDPDRMATAAGVVAEGIGKATGLDQATLDQRAAAFAADARAAGAAAEETLAAVPADQRVLVTNHEALGYFARRFDLRLVGTVIPGGSTMAEPSAADIASLANAVRDAGVKAVFAENTVSPQVAESLAREAGVRVVVLYTDALGPKGGEAGTYPDLIRTDARLVADGLLGRSS